MASDPDDTPTLSVGTLAALQEFYREQEVKEAKKNEAADSVVKDEDVLFEENWVSSNNHEKCSVRLFSPILNLFSAIESILVLRGDDKDAGGRFFGRFTVGWQNWFHFLSNCIQGTQETKCGRPR